MLAVDAHDLAFGTSRWSSKLVHGGLRYLAHGQVGVAHESAVERGILMEVTAPHLTRPLPMLAPLMSSVSRAPGRAHPARPARRRRAADLRPHRRRDAAPPRAGSRPPRRCGWPPPCAATACAAACCPGTASSRTTPGWSTTVARTAASYGAHVRTRARVTAATGTRVELRDERTGGDAAPSPPARSSTRPASGPATWPPTSPCAPAAAPTWCCAPTRCPASPSPSPPRSPGETNRFVLVLPQPDGTVYVGLTDEPVDGPPPDVPEPSEAEIGFLLDVVGAAFARPLRRDDVVGAFAGLRPLLDAGAGRTSDLSREHAVLTGPTGLVTVVGGKLTTYRRMAQDAVDAAVAHAGLAAGPCVTATTPLLGAAPRDELARLELPPRLVRRYGTDAALVLATARRTGLEDAELLAPASDGCRSRWPSWSSG